MAGALRTCVRWVTTGLLAGIFLLVAPLASAADCAELLGRCLCWAPATTRLAARIAVSGTLLLMLALAAGTLYT
eukprot:8045539-Alexandrium_andersonii.AAC.1